MQAGDWCKSEETAGDVDKDNRDMRKEGGFLSAYEDKQQAGWAGPSLSGLCVVTCFKFD